MSCPSHLRLFLGPSKVHSGWCGPGSAYSVSVSGLNSWA
jgi:hypothetical protein